MVEMSAGTFVVDEQPDYYEIHTSDRTLFKRCRRKWWFRSPLCQHLVPKDQPQNINLWFGTGFHFALEDYHGYNYFGDPVKALEAYYLAFRPEELPEDADDIVALGMDMFEYYKKWLERRDYYKTVWLNGEPLVEVPFELEVAEVSAIRDKPVVYRGTIDRIVEDPEGNWWVEDFKTAARIDTNKLANDPQISTYVWAAEQVFEREIMGMLFTQFAKDTPKPPKELKNGELSVNKQQKTTHRIYRDALLERYPDGNFPGKYVEFLNELAEKETPEGDRFIRRDEVHRNTDAKISTYNHIVKEATEMTNPDLMIYPNPTRDCSWDCAEYRSVCLAMDEGGDWEYMLSEFFETKQEEGDEWQNRITWPEEANK